MFQQPGDDGVEVEERTIHGIPVTAVEIKTEDGAESLDRAVGKYITIQTGLLSSETLNLKALGECVSEVLTEVLSRYKGSTLCICGLGNRELVADSLGPDVIRNLSLKVFSGVASLNGLFKSVCSFVPGTAWTNNLDTELMVKGILKEANANCLLLIDSLITRNPERLCQSIQVSTAGGMNPFFAGRSIDWSSLGVPVISIGVPLAITADTFIQSGVLTDESFTTLHAHHAVAASSFIISYAILRTCWPDLTTQDCIDFIRFNRDVIPYPDRNFDEDDTGDNAVPDEIT